MGVSPRRGRRRPASSTVSSWRSASAARGSGFRAGPHFMGFVNPHFIGRASLGLGVGIFCDFLYGVLLMSTIMGLDLSGLAATMSNVASSTPAVRVVVCGVWRGSRQWPCRVPQIRRRARVRGLRGARAAHLPTAFLRAWGVKATGVPQRLGQLQGVNRALLRAPRRTARVRRVGGAMRRVSVLRLIKDF